MKQYVLYYLFVLTLFISCKHTRSIKVKGSDTEVNLTVQLAEEFRKQNDEIILSVSGGGSGLGIASLLNGNTDIANSSREIKEKELVLFEKRGIQLDSFVFAQDAIAFIVNKEIDLEIIKVNDLAKVLSGEYSKWNEITHQNKDITIYGRQSNSGTYDFIKSKLEIDYDSHAKQMNGNAQIVEGVKADKTGIGYVGAGYVSENDSNYKILKIQDEIKQPISPLNKEEIKLGNYYFQRPLFQFYKHDSYSRIKPFLDFEKTQLGQDIILKAGYYPTNKGYE